MVFNSSIGGAVFDGDAGDDSIQFNTITLGGAIIAGGAGSDVFGSMEILSSDRVG